MLIPPFCGTTWQRAQVWFLLRFTSCSDKFLTRCGGDKKRAPDQHPFCFSFSEKGEENAQTGPQNKSFVYIIGECKHRHMLQPTTVDLVRPRGRLHARPIFFQWAFDNSLHREVDREGSRTYRVRFVCR